MSMAFAGIHGVNVEHAHNHQKPTTITPPFGRLLPMGTPASTKRKHVIRLAEGVKVWPTKIFTTVPPVCQIPQCCGGNAAFTDVGLCSLLTIARPDARASMLQEN